jgi:hypothetical protein
MGDRTNYSIMFYAVPKRPQHKMGPGWKQVSTDARVLELLKQYGFSEIWDEGKPDEPMPDIETESGIRIGAVYIGPEVSLGMEDFFGPELDKLGVTYELHGDAYGEYEAVLRYSTPHLGVFESIAEQSEGLPLVTTKHIEQLIAECADHQELIDRLSLATGKAWRDFFKRANLPPTDDDMRLARLSLLRAEEALTDA